MKEIPAKVSKSGVDSYFMDPLIVDNYEDFGVYYKCRLSYYGQTDSLFKVSDISVAAPYTRKLNTIFCIIMLLDDANLNKTKKRFYYRDLDIKT